jgi:glutamate transport system substrate-binding protein
MGSIRTLRTFGAILAGGALVVAAGCGSDNSGSSSATTASATTAGAATTAAGTTAAATTAAGGEYCSKATPGGSVDRLCKADKIVIGTKFDQPLFGLKNPTNNEVEGFDVEIAKIIVKNLGKEPSDIDFQETVSRVREDVIVNGQRDLVVATYTINDARKEKVDFAGPYYVAGQDIMVKSDNTTITDKASLDGKQVCTAAGSTPETRLKAETTAEVTTFPTYSECAEALRDGRVEAVSTDNVILLGLIDQSGGEFKLVGKPFSTEPYGIGLKKGDTELRTFVNDVLEAAYQDGTWAAAYASTIGTVDTSPTPTPPPVDRYS